MIRTTLLLPEDLRQRAFEEARRLGVSFGEFVREAMLAALAGSSRKGGGRDSLLSDRATYKGPVPRDSSTRLDDYLYGDKP